ncbi:MAG: IS21-like element helper ATPase IstB [Lachnospiraceae bacterium]|jgi:DNA replication protein DnaC|nr:IS21-like element helper ATPase IstB [Lachnospiraceae bacterium]
MNSSSVYTRITENLRFLKSKESLDVIDKTIDYVNQNNLSFIDGFLYFTEAQVEKKKANLVSHSVNMAGFPKVKTLADFDFDYQPSINKQQIYDLNSLRFIEKLENIVFYGNSGVGKTHLATAIGITAAQNRNSTYFIKCAELMESLHKAQLEGRFAERLKKYCGYKVLIIDELGYLPISREDSKLFFQLIDRRYERNSTIITTNINFSQWDEIFGDPLIADAIIDRLLHHATVVTIKGKSYRLQNLLYGDGDSA